MNTVANAGIKTGVEAGQQAQTKGTITRAVILAGALGTLIEYFDYTIYAFLATTLAAVFFPAGESLALLYTFGVFAVAFIARPLGGIILGAIADRHGRKPALMVSVLGMITATACIGLLPTYSTIGIAAPVLLCLMRCLQGLAAGGEMGGAAAYIAEVSPDDRRGALVSTTQIGCLVGTMIGALVVAQLHATIGNAQLLTWGWRIPFLLSLPLGAVTVIVRRKMVETEDFLALEKTGSVERMPYWTALRLHPVEVFSVMGIALGAFSGYYITFTYLVTYFPRQAMMTAQQAGWSSSLSMFVAALVIYPFGKLSDRIGRRPVLIGATAGFALFTYPLFSLMGVSIPAAVIAHLVLGLFAGAYQAVALSTYSELFPPSVRTSGMNLGFNIAAILGGGSAPYLATWLVANTGSARSPAWIIIIASAISMLVTLCIKETANRPMRTA